MRIAATILFCCSWLAGVSAEGLLKWPGKWVPYLERIDTKDFLIVEDLIKESATDDCDLVIYEIREGKFLGRKTLRKSDESGYILSTLTIDYHTGQQTVKTVKLPADIGGRLLEVITLAMTKMVYPPSGNSRSFFAGTEASIWLHQKMNSNSTISGLVLVSRCGYGDVSTPPFLELMSRLWRCAANDASEGPPLLKLDFAIAALRSSYPERP